MRKIIAAELVTLDGVMEAPGSGDTTLADRRGWSEPFMNGAAALIGTLMGGLVTDRIGGRKVSIIADALSLITALALALTLFFDK